MKSDVQQQQQQQQQAQPQQLAELSNSNMSSHVKLEMDNGQVVVVDSSQLENVTLVQQSAQQNQNMNPFTEQSNQFNQQQQQVSLTNSNPNIHQLVVNSNGTVSNMVDSSLIGRVFININPNIPTHLAGLKLFFAQNKQLNNLWYIHNL